MDLNDFPTSGIFFSNAWKPANLYQGYGSNPWTRSAAEKGFWFFQKQ